MLGECVVMIIREFTVSPEGYQKIKNELLVKTSVAMLIILVSCTAILFSDKESMSYTIYLLPFLILFLAYKTYRGIGTQKARFESYKLIIEDDAITRKLLNTPDIRLKFDEITQIEKSSKGSILIKSESRSNTICVFLQVENIHELELILNTIQPVTTKSGALYLKYLNYVVLIIVMFGMLAIYTSTNKIIVGISGIMLLTMLGWGFYVIRTNKNIDSKIKNKSWIFLLVFLSIIATIYIKLTA